MARLLVRLASLAGGLGLTEIGLGSALADGAAAGWLLVLIGLALIVVGSAGFVGTLFGGDAHDGGSADA